MTRTKQTARTARVRYGRGRLNPVGRSRGAASDSRRGAALLIAIIVLTALFLLAIPFAAFMRRQHASGTQALHTARARYAEAGALSHARAVLCQGLSNIEDPANPFPFDDPDVDTLWEFRVTLRTTANQPLDFADLNGDGIDDIPLRTFQVADALGLPNDGDQTTVDGFIRVDHEWMAYSHVAGLTASATTGTLTVLAEHRGLFGTTPSAHIAGGIVSFFRESELWHLDVEDQQARININTAPYQVILNLLGYLGIGDEAGVPAPAPGDANFPNQRQQNLAAAISSYRIYYSYWNTADNIPDGAYTRFQNLNMLKNISVAPWFASGGGLSGPELDLLLPYVTVHSEPAGADPWLTLGGISLAADINPTVAPPPLDATVLWAARLDNASRVPLGSVVRLFDPLYPLRDPDYRLITSVNANVGLTSSIGAAYLGWVDVVGPDLMRFRQLRTSTSPTTEAYTPGYIYINDPGSEEWIEYSDVDVAGSQIYISGRGLFATLAAPHTGSVATPIPMDGNVIGWRYLDSTGGDYTFAVNVHYSPTAQIAIENRHAININTVADPLILRSILYGMWDGRPDPADATQPDPAQYIDDAEATAIANHLLSYTSGQGIYTAYNHFIGNEDWVDGVAGSGGLAFPPTTPRGELNALLTDVEANPPAHPDPPPATITVSLDERDMLIDNFDETAPGLWPQVSTVPLRFDSGTLIGIRSLGVVDDRAGTPIASAAIGRVYDVVPPLEGLSWALRTQQEFYDWMVATGQRVQDGGQILSSFLNEDLPAALLMADDRYTKPASPTGIQWGFVAPALDTLNPTLYTTVLEGLHESPSAFSLDYSVAADTQMTGPDTPTVNNTTSGGVTNVQLEYRTDYAAAARWRHIEADSFHATIQPFAVEFWMKPGADVTTRQLLLDIGDGSVPGDWPETACNQIRLYLEGSQLVLRMDDPIQDIASPAVFGGYVEARSSSPRFDFDPQEWHHVAVAVVGTFRDDIAMFIDGIYDQGMTWSYHYVNSLGGHGIASEAMVTEGYFWPVAMTVPNRQYTLANIAGPPANTIVLTDTTGLPTGGGMLAITTSANVYEYSNVDPATGVVTLVNPLMEPHLPGAPVAFPIPVVRPAVHNVPDDVSAVPAPGHSIGLWSHTGSGNGSFNSDDPSTIIGAETVDVIAAAAIAPLSTYMWLSIDPNRYPLGGTAGDLTVGRRWKVFNYDAFMASLPGTLAGGLPSGPGTLFTIGGPRQGSAELAFQGELDEVRITTLPTALVTGPGALGGGNNVTVQEWYWYNDGTVHPGGWPCAGLGIGAANGLAGALGISPLQPTGGYFVGPDTELYSYQWYNAAAGEIGEIERVYDDLSPASGTGTAPAGLHRIIPLNFITSTRLALPIGPADIVIPVWDVSQFPESGYVRIDNEIIAYSSRDPGNNWLILSTDPTVASAYPRGAYGTTASAHIQDPVLGTWPVVRHVPVRHLDRYHAEDELYIGPWAKHQAYSDADLGADMCMLSVSVNHAGQVERVAWRFRDLLEDGQKVIVLVLIDDAVPWNTDPDDDADGDDTTSGDMLWGTIIQEPAPTDGELVLHTATGDHPTVNTRVEVRFYFDLGDTHAYNKWLDLTDPLNPVVRDGWSNMVELDEVVIEMVPRPMSF